MYKKNTRGLFDFSWTFKGETTRLPSRVCIFSDFIFSVENRKKYFFSAEKTEKPKKSQKPKKPKKMAQKTEKTEKQLLKKNEKRRRNPKNSKKN